MSIDRADSHYDDAGSMEKAARHICLFLLWATERGLAAKNHDAKSIAADPCGYFDRECDGKLWTEDFTERGNRFVEAVYCAYLGEVHAFAERLGVGDYDIPDEDITRAHFFAWLDKTLADETSWNSGDSAARGERGPQHQ